MSERLMNALGKTSWCMWPGLPPCPACGEDHGDEKATADEDRVYRAQRAGMCHVMGCANKARWTVTAYPACDAHLIPTVEAAMRRTQDLAVNVWTFAGWVRRATEADKEWCPDCDHEVRLHDDNGCRISYSKAGRCECSRPRSEAK